MYEPSEKTLENISDLVKTFNRRIGQAKRKTPIQYQQYLPQKMTVAKFLETVGSYKDVQAQAKALMAKDIIPQFGKSGAKPTKLQEARYESVKNLENKRLAETQEVERYDEGKPTGIERVKKRSKAFEIRKKAEEFTPLELEIRIRQLERRQTQEYKKEKEKQWAENYKKAVEINFPTFSRKILQEVEKVPKKNFMLWVQQEDFLDIDYVYDKSEEQEKASNYLENLRRRIAYEKEKGNL
nr:MAG TPA: hypothetical protein [Caudoviricetes sp.]